MSSELIDYLYSASSCLDRAVQNCDDLEMADELDAIEARLDEMIKKLIGK